MSHHVWITRNKSRVIYFFRWTYSSWSWPFFLPPISAALEPPVGTGGPWLEIPYCGGISFSGTCHTGPLLTTSPCPSWSCWMHPWSVKRRAWMIGKREKTTSPSPKLTTCQSGYLCLFVVSRSGGIIVSLDLNCHLDLNRYLKGCPSCRQQWLPSRPAYEVVTSFLQSLVVSSEPRYAMFGPGMEHLDVSLVTRLMHAPDVLPVSGTPHRQINGKLTLRRLFLGSSWNVYTCVIYTRFYQTDSIRRRMVN